MKGLRHPGWGALALLALAACETPAKLVPLTDVEIGQLNAGLEAATVGVGDQFLYDNPDELWEVIAIDGPFVVWRNQVGDEHQRSYNAIFPSLRWTGVSISGRRHVTVIDGGLFPLAKDKSVSFLVDGASERPPGRWRSRWKCTVQEQLETVVTAGKVEAWRVLCLRNGREQFVFDYAPSLGHYVRLVSATEEQPSIRQLKAYRRGSEGGPILQMPAPAPAAAAAPDDDAATPSQ